jgi:outer membrane protein
MNRPLLMLLTLLLLLGSQSARAADDLLRVYRLAAESDPQLRAAEAAWRAAQELRPQARALLLPQLGAGVSLNRTRSDFEAGPSRTLTGRTYSISLSQPVYRRDRLVQLRQADARIAQAEAQFEAATQNLITRVSDRYFEVLAARDNLEFAESERTAIARQLEQARQRFEVGLIAITDVHEAQARFDLAVAQEIAAENQLFSAREALREFTGEFHEQLAGLAEEIPLAAPEPTEPDAWAATALEQNLQLLAAQFAVEVARTEIERRRSGHYPTVDVIGSLSRSEDGRFSTGFDDQLIGGDRDDASVGLQINVPLYTGGGVTSQTREARQLFEQAREQLEQQRRLTLRQTQDAYRSVVALISQVRALRQAVISNQSALEATQAGFEVGTRTIVDVLNAQRELFLAQRNFARARYDYLINTLLLKESAGVLTDEDVEMINALLR